MTKIMEAEVRNRVSRCSQNNKRIEIVNVNTPPAQKWLPNMEVVTMRSRLNDYNTWKCDACLQKEMEERKLLEMEKNKPAKFSSEDGEQIPGSKSQHSPGGQPGYSTDSQITSPKTKSWTKGVTQETYDLHRAFSLKVNHFTTLLLAITIGIISGLMYWNVVQGWQQKNIWFCCKLFPAISVLMFVIACCENNCKKFPLSFILSLMTAIVEGLVLGVVSSFFVAMTVMQVGGITAFVTLVLSWFAMKTKWNICRVAVPLWIAVPGLAIFGTLCIFNKSPTLQLTYALLGTLFFAIGLMKAQINIRTASAEVQKPTDYAFLALNLYINIVTLFFFILQLTESI